MRAMLVVSLHKIKITDDHKNGAMDDEQDAAGASFVRRLTGQESVRSTTDRKVALHL